MSASNLRLRSCPVYFNRPSLVKYYFEEDIHDDNRIIISEELLNELTSVHEADVVKQVANISINFDGGGGNNNQRRDSALSRQRLRYIHVQIPQEQSQKPIQAIDTGEDNTAKVEFHPVQLETPSRIVQTLRTLSSEDMVQAKLNSSAFRGRVYLKRPVPFQLADFDSGLTRSFLGRKRRESGSALRSRFSLADNSRPHSRRTTATDTSWDIEYHVCTMSPIRNPAKNDMSHMGTIGAEVCRFPVKHRIALPPVSGSTCALHVKPDKENSTEKSRH